MTEPWMREMQKLERLGPTEDLFERARRGPVKPLPPGPTRGRYAAIALSGVISLIAIGLVWTAFLPSTTVHPPAAPVFRLPTDPCALVTTGQVAAVTGSGHVTSIPLQPADF